MDKQQEDAQTVHKARVSILEATGAGGSGDSKGSRDSRAVGILGAVGLLEQIVCGSGPDAELTTLRGQHGLWHHQTITLSLRLTLTLALTLSLALKYLPSWRQLLYSKP